MKYIQKNFILIFIIAAIGFIFSININKPFIGHHDFNSAFFSIIADNLSKYSVIKTKLGQIENSGSNAINVPVFYTHNVPLFTWILSLTFFLFGKGEVQARTISILFSIGCVIFIYKIAKRIFSKLIATLSILFYAFSSMIIYFSGIVFPEPISIFFSLASFYFYINWTNKRNTNDYIYLAVFSFLALLTVWGSYFLPPFIVAHYLIFVKKKDYKKIVMFTFIPGFTFLLFLSHIKLLTGSYFGGGLMEAFLFRTNQDSNQLYSFSLINFINRETHLLIAYYSKLTILLVAIWFINYLNCLLNKKSTKEHNLLLILFAWGVSYPLFFTNASYIHDYFLIYLAPFISISSAYLVSKLCFLLFENKMKYRLITAIIFIFPFFQYYETRNFTLALLQTNANKDGFTLGNILKKETISKDRIIVLSDQFGAHFGVFTNYYSDREVNYSNVSIENIKKENITDMYNYAVIVEGREAGKSVEDYLNSDYKKKEIGMYKLYNLKK